MPYRLSVRRWRAPKQGSWVHAVRWWWPGFFLEDRFS
ncbi:hypothetical protein BU14_0592s0006 [Porphyra umbilicalis]|uniref:Uncharacterized protein n=1 Tax=Porphyra umbilicalis TaxID=2786 RepID=A0A1X6NR76_PORUM|nr:hypothetical protein BU14_0592s0006 [Porphyra umbilicalis]|eukprot:OSX71111.1 hypothetical protein BU14_0592s0006 [Porphyra umbilicalis]